MSRLTEYAAEFDAYDYLPDNKRDPADEPLYAIIAQLLTEAVRDKEKGKVNLLDPLISEIMSEYEDDEAVRAYFNTSIQDKLGMEKVVLRLFDLLELKLGITEWFNSEYPVIPYKFYVDIYEYPDRDIHKIIDLIYRVKNERSHLLSFRDVDRNSCPGYFILNKSKLSSFEYLTDAKGYRLNGVKVCYTFYYSHKLQGAIVNTDPARDGHYTSTAYMSPANVSIFEADGILDAPSGHVVVDILPPAVSFVPIANLSGQDEIYQSYSYNTQELQYVPLLDDAYSIRHPASTGLHVNHSFGTKIGGFTIDFSLNYVSSIRPNVSNGYVDEDAFPPSNVS